MDQRDQATEPERGQRVIAHRRRRLGREPASPLLTRQDVAELAFDDALDRPHCDPAPARDGSVLAQDDRALVEPAERVPADRPLHPLRGFLERRGRPAPDEEHVVGVCAYPGEGFGVLRPHRPQDQAFGRDLDDGRRAHRPATSETARRTICTHSSTRSRWVRCDRMQARIVNRPSRIVLESTTRLDALIRSSRRLVASSPPSRRRNGTTVSSGSPNSSSSGICESSPYRYRARSSFSSSASRKAFTPCSTSGNHTRRPRKSRESSIEYSVKFGISSSGGKSCR